MKTLSFKNSSLFGIFMRLEGLIGLGRVGSQVAKIAKAFGMQVMAWSENLDLDKCTEFEVLPSTKEDLIRKLNSYSICKDTQYDVFEKYIYWKGEIIGGVIDCPALKERWISFERDVTTVNGDVIKCRKIDQLEYSVMATTSSHQLVM